MANNGSNDVTVIDGATNSATTVSAGSAPYSVAVNPVTNTVYVANNGSNTVTVIDGATNSTTTVATGISPFAVAVNTITNKIYVANGNSNNVTVIDGATNSATTVAAGTAPVAVVVNPVTNKVYAANFRSNNVTVIDGAANSATTVAVGTNPQAVAVNPVTNKVYVANVGSNDVTVIDVATNSTTTIAAGSMPWAVAVNPVTNKVYVVNYDSKDVTVIDGSINSTTTVAVGTNPRAVAVNPVTNKIYVVNYVSRNVTVIDGVTNSTTTVDTGALPVAVAVNPVTNKVYVANYLSDSVTVIDGTTNSATTVAVGRFPQAVAVNPVTNKIYVANCLSNNVTVIDGATNSATTVTAGSYPGAVAVNPVTDKIYVANSGSNDVTVIDGADNSTTTVAVLSPGAVMVNPVTNKVYVANSSNVTVIDGATNSVTTVAAGSRPNAMAVNPVTNKVYVANNSSSNVTIITEQMVQPIPLTTTITPLADNTATVSNPTFSYTVASSYAPIAPPVQKLYYQVDTWTGQWQMATAVAGSGSFTIPEQLGGLHTVYAFAADGQEATSTNTGFGNGVVPGTMAAYTVLIPTVPGAPQNVTATAGNTQATVSFTAPSSDGASPITGYTVTSDPAGGVDSDAGSNSLTHTVTGLTNGTAYTFTVTATNAVGTGPASSASNSVTPFGLTDTTTTVSATPNPSLVGGTVTFTATVTPATATGTVTFLDGATTLGQGTLASGVATLNIATLTAGSHAITAVYGGDSSYSASTSTEYSQVVQSPQTLSVSNSPQIYDGTAKTATVLCSGGGAVSNLQNAVQTTAGTYTVTADCSANGDYAAGAGLTANFVINPAAQTITFNTLANKTLGDADFTVSASATSGLAVTFSSTTAGVCTTSGTTVHLVAAGTCTIRAAQAGTANYIAATAVDQSFTVAKAASATSVISSLNPATVGQSVTFTATVVPATATGTVTFKDGATVLGTAPLNGGAATVSTGSLSVGSHTITAVFSGDVNYNVSTSSPLTQTVTAEPLVITTAILADGYQGKAYSQTLAATGGVTPYAWSVTGSAKLPKGLTLNAATGVISGTTTVAANNCSITFQVKDAVGTITTKNLPLTVYTLPGVGTTVLPAATLGVPYRQALVGKGGKAPYTWTLAAGSTLPAGLTLGSDGVISGTPTVVVAMTFYPLITDANGMAATPYGPLGIKVTVPDLRVSSVTGPAAINRGATRYTFTATVTNVGTGSAGASTVSLYLTKTKPVTTTTSATNYLLGTVPVGVLAAGANQKVTLTVTVPNSVTAGSYYIGAVADSGAVVLEADDTNNGQVSNSLTTVK